MDDRDLRWEPSDLLGRDDLRVEELSCLGAAYDPRAAIEIGVRAERLRARGGPEYFTLWPRAYIDPEQLSCVIRRTPAGEEVHVGHGEWVRSRMLDEVEGDLYPFYRALPITAEEAEEILAHRSDLRCYHVLSGNDTRDVPFADESALRVQEFLPNWTPDDAAFRMARAVRRRRRDIEWQGEHWYFASFPDDVTALDLANARQLVRTDAGDTCRERVCHHGEWTGSSVLDDICRGKSDDEYLPISPDEARKLMARLDG